MLKKKICKKCFKQLARKRGNEAWEWGWQDEERWREQMIYCVKGYQNIQPSRISFETALENCPYALEHIVLEQKNAE